jgi:hypothetical protein
MLLAATSTCAASGAQHARRNDRSTCPSSGRRRRLNSGSAVRAASPAAQVVARSASRSTNLRILPEGVRGKSSTTRISSIHFCFGRPTARRCAWTVERSGASSPARIRRMPQACSPTRSSGAATTAHSATADRVSEGLFDLRRREVQASTNDHVAQPVGDRQVAVVVEYAHVTGAIPSVRSHHAGRELGVRVAGEQVRASRRISPGCPRRGRDPPRRRAASRRPRVRGHRFDCVRLRLAERRSVIDGAPWTRCRPDHLDPELLCALGDGLRDRCSTEPYARDELACSGRKPGLSRRLVRKTVAPPPSRCRLPP